MKHGVVRSIAICILLVVISLCFVGCDFLYSLVYTEFIIQIDNNSGFDITEVTISKGDEVVQTDIDIIEVDESREYIVTERSVYTVEGTLSNTSMFLDEIDFASIERKIVEVE